MTGPGNGDGVVSDADRAGRWGIVFVAHGSQRGTSPQECACSWHTAEDSLPDWCPHCPSTPRGLQDAAGRLQAALGMDRAQVVLACLEFIEPRPDQTIRWLSAHGFKRMVIMPYLLGQGKHVTLEMDEILAEVRAEMPHLDLHLADGLGADPSITDILVERVRTHTNNDLTSTGERGPTGVLLVKAGTKNQYDDCLWLEDLARMVENRLGLDYAVAVAQSHYGDPTVEAGAARLMEERGASSIVVVPYVFFPGLILKRNILGGMERLAQKYPGLPLTVTPPLGVDDRLIAAAAGRVRQVWDQVEGSKA